MPPLLVAGAALVAEFAVPEALAAAGVGGIVTASGALTAAGAIIGAVAATAVTNVGAAVIISRAAHDDPARRH
jgi:hypothetical protein